jgi:hypothetical protein
VGALRGLGLGVLLVETAGPFLSEQQFNDDIAPRPPLHGAYAVTSLQLSRPATTAPLRLFVHRQGYLLTQQKDGQLQDYKLTYAPGLLLLNKAGQIGRLRYTASPKGLRLTGTLGADSVRWLARPLPWRQLPLLRGGHWVAE